MTMMSLHRRATARDGATRRRPKHDFEVSGYSRLKALGVGQFVSSATFTAGGRDWAVRAYRKQGTARFTLRRLRRREQPPAAMTALADDLGRLLATATGADVGGRAFPAHRAVLAARSPVFMAELFGGMVEKDARGIKVAGVRPEVFGMLLRVIYTESLPGDGEGSPSHWSSASECFYICGGGSL
nr:unnamed protein product [Digitaria exilis]